jgi:hypothetical protein
LIKGRISTFVWTLLATGIALVNIGCAVSPVARTGVVVSVRGSYNYSPSVIQSGQQQQFWWCARANNPSNPSQSSDTIQYQAVDLATGETQSPVTVLAETAGSWDAAFVCNPRVIKGTFSNPLGNGQTYSYEMFYVATSNSTGITNSVGAAFSNDGITWNKYPSPLISSSRASSFGIAQPAAYNQDGKSGIVLFYEDDTSVLRHVKALSTDGIHFTEEGTLTILGLDKNNGNPSWGDIGHDPVTGYWYAGFNLPSRAPGTTDGVVERGDYGIQLYRIPNTGLLTGTTPWQLVKTFDTNLTGYEANFLPGFLHDEFGNLNVGTYPEIKLFTSISDPAPAWNASPADAGASGDIFKWVIGSASWSPDEQTVPLNRYANLVTFEVTSGWIDPGADFKLQSTVGHLYITPQNGADVPFYGCKTGTIDYFLSRDSGCESERILGLNGFGYGEPPAGISTVPLYRCFSDGKAHFISHDPKCEGRSAGTLLGYALP